MKYLLDTHTLLWVGFNSNNLGREAARALAGLGRESVAVSDVSLFEAAQLSEKGKISLVPGTRAFLDRVEQSFTILPITPAIAIDAVNVALPHADPFDRLIVATARQHRLILITKDGNITDSGAVKVLW